MYRVGSILCAAYYSSYSRHHFGPALLIWSTLTVVCKDGGYGEMACQLCKGLGCFLLLQVNKAWACSKIASHLARTNQLVGHGS